ncbi:UNVERIFIED_ORG: hypothetical protein GCAPEGMB_00272 [Vibrio phage V07]|nr:hypothetical protein COHAPHLL_00344 [Vibrio phage V09]UNA01749.1 hypothetical protein [Vibrio phage PC-Liy1]URQ03045.1 hypothetical protein PVA8_59 [Vibrio phage PVA8]WBM58781.1 hypothetical protein vBValMPVA8_59 [Vibrio phage vB_ValM_PVA8]
MEYMSFIAFVGFVAYAIYILVRKEPCKHDWITIKDDTTKSRGEIYGEMTGKVPSPRNSYHMEELTKRKRIIILSCCKCGKLDKTVENI